MQQWLERRLPKAEQAPTRSILLAWTKGSRVGKKQISRYARLIEEEFSPSHRSWPVSYTVEGLSRKDRHLFIYDLGYDSRQPWSTQGEHITATSADTAYLSLIRSHYIFSDIVGEAVFKAVKNIPVSSDVSEEKTTWPSCDSKATAEKFRDYFKNKKKTDEEIEKIEQECRKDKNKYWFNFYVQALWTRYLFISPECFEVVLTAVRPVTERGRGGGWGGGEVQMSIRNVDSEKRVSEK